MKIKTVLEHIQPLNQDELFYKEYFYASKSEKRQKAFLASINPDEIIRRHLVVPEIMPDIISYNMNDSEYFHEEDNTSVYISRHNRYTPAFLHKHSFFEIVCILSGHCTQTIGTKTLYFHPGDVCFIAPGTFHTMEVFDDESLVFNILLRRSTFYQMFTPLTLGDHLLSQFFSEGLYANHRLEYLIFHTNMESDYLNYILYLYGEQLEKDEYTNQIMVGKLTEAHALMMRKFKSTMESSYSTKLTNQPNDFLIINYIQEHFVDLSLQDVADYFGFSVSYCSRMIKTYTGQSFNNWKRNLRLRRAEHLLINSDESITDICYSLGYMNPESFIRAFKKEIHMTPAQYRKHARKNHDSTTIGK